MGPELARDDEEVLERDSEVTAAQHSKGIHRHQTVRLRLVQVVRVTLYTFYHNKTIYIRIPRGNTEKEGFISGKRSQMPSTKRICPCENTHASIQGIKGTQQIENIYGKRMTILGFYSLLFTVGSLVLFAQ